MNLLNFPFSLMIWPVLSKIANLFITLKTFGECSFLKINNEKTEALALGNSRSLWEGLHSDLPNLCNTIKILGINVFKCILCTLFCFFFVFVFLFSFLRIFLDFLICKMDVFFSSNKIFHDISLELGWTWK